MEILTIVFVVAIFAYLIAAGQGRSVKRMPQAEPEPTRYTRSAEDGVRVNFTSNKSKKIFKDNIGEYVDFEEIQDKD